MSSGSGPAGLMDLRPRLVGGAVSKPVSTAAVARKDNVLMLLIMSSTSAFTSSAMLDMEGWEMAWRGRESLQLVGK